MTNTLYINPMPDCVQTPHKHFVEDVLSIVSYAQPDKIITAESVIIERMTGKLESRMPQAILR